MKILDFYGIWCNPCRMQSKILDDFQKRHPEVEIHKIDVDEEEELTNKYGVRNLPTLIFINKDKIKQVSGLQTLDKLEAIYNEVC